eukprot:6382583-Prymnesium_polylepis.1
MRGARAINQPEMAICPNMEERPPAALLPHIRRRRNAPRRRAAAAGQQGAAAHARECGAEGAAWHEAAT